MSIKIFELNPYLSEMFPERWVGFIDNLRLQNNKIIHDACKRSKSKCHAMVMISEDSS